MTETSAQNAMTDVRPELVTMTTMPQFLKDRSTQALTKIGNVQKSLYKKLESIRKLKEHIESHTQPSSLTWTPKVFVKAALQEQVTHNIGTVVEEATQKILTIVLQAREMELQDLNSDIQDIKQEWTQETTRILTQMKSESILTQEVEPLIQTYTQEFERVISQQSNHYAQEDFFARLKKDESDLKAREKRAILATNQVLRNPEVEALQKEMKVLTKTIKDLGKKDNAKPGRKQGTPGGGKRNPKKDNQGKKGKPKNGKPKGKGGGDHGKQGPPTPSKPGTNPSGSRKPSSRRKQN